MNDRFIQWLTIEWKTKFQNLFFPFENHQCHMCLHLCWQFSVQHPLTNRRLSMSTVMMPSTLTKFKGHLEEKTNPSVSPRCFFTPHAHYSRIFILNPILIWPDPTVTANANLADCCPAYLLKKICWLVNNVLCFSWRFGDPENLLFIEVMQ